MNRKAIATVLVGTVFLAILLYWRSCRSKPPIVDPSPPAAGKLAIIWWDVTRSLYQSEKDQGLEWAVEIVSNLPPKSRYFILPIHSETQRADPLDQGEVPELRTKQAAVLFGGRLRIRIKEKAEKLKKAIKEDDERFKRDLAVVRRDRQTCILNTLNFSSTLLNNEPKQLQPEIVFISDMIEDCFHQNVNGGNGGFIQLSQPGIDVQIRSATVVNLPEDLINVRLTVVIPTASSNSGVSERPGMDGLQRFWATVFERVKVKPENIHWSIGVVPPRLVNKDF